MKENFFLSEKEINPFKNAMLLGTFFESEHSGIDYNMSNGELGLIYLSLLAVITLQFKVHINFKIAMRSIFISYKDNLLNTLTNP